MKKPKRIAAIYWHTGSVGGLNSNLQYLKRAAESTGDTFHILRSTNYVKATHGLFPEIKRIKGGDTYIFIDGFAGHHPKHVAGTVQWLNENYDAILLPALVPHITRTYGNQPDFLPLFTDTDMPKIGTLSDGYWASYAEWGRMAIPYVTKLYTGCEAYTIAPRAEGIKVEVQPRPYIAPAFVPVPQSPKLLTVWMHQWKQIKGIKQFMKAVPKIPGRIELYSVGIEYFKFRTLDIWKAAVGKNLVHPEFGGSGKAVYYGWIPLNDTIRIYQRAWFSVGLQGITQKLVKQSLFGGVVPDPKSIYAQGSHNNAEIEALRFGAVPVLHEQVLKSDLPRDMILTVKNGDELPGLIASHPAQDFARDPVRRKRAAEYVMDRHDAVRIYREMKKAAGI